MMETNRGNKYKTNNTKGGGGGEERERERLEIWYFWSVVVKYIFFT